jgi:hypothetical protein
MERDGPWHCGATPEVPPCRSCRTFPGYKKGRHGDEILGRVPVVWAVELSCLVNRQNWENLCPEDYWSAIFHVIKLFFTSLII